MMTTLEIICLVALGILAMAVIVIFVPKLVFHFLEGPLESRIAACYGPDEIVMKDLRANCFGLESAGVWQVRGNGGLVLTAEFLHFFMFLPNRNIRVPLDAISELTFTKSHLGKATPYDLLRVRFAAEGKMDSIAWYLTDPAGWKNKIEELRCRRPGPV
jgi:hypothetical protein